MSAARRRSDMISVLRSQMWQIWSKEHHVLRIKYFYDTM